MLGNTTDEKDEAFTEHLAHGTDRPGAMLRQGNWKLCYYHSDEPEYELYDLVADPGEFSNLAGRPEHAEVQSRMLNRILDIWGTADGLDLQIRDEQQARLLIRNVMGGDATF